MGTESPSPSRSPSQIEQGEVYKINKQDELPLTVYVQRKKDPTQHDWYRIQSWPVVFLGFEEFDLRVHRPLDFHDGWIVTEATTGMSIVKDDGCHDPETPCEAVGWLITQGKLTVEKMRDGIAKGKDRLAELGLSARSEKVTTVEVMGHDGKPVSARCCLLGCQDFPMPRDDKNSTPRTNAIDGAAYWRVIEHAQQLERELNAARSATRLSESERQLIGTAELHLRTWVRAVERGSNDVRPYANTLDVADRLNALLRPTEGTAQLPGPHQPPKVPGWDPKA